MKRTDKCDVALFSGFAGFRKLKDRMAYILLLLIFIGTEQNGMIARQRG